MFDKITWVNNTSKTYNKVVNPDGTWVVTPKSPNGTPISVDNLNALKKDIDYITTQTDSIKPQIAVQIDELLYFINASKTTINNNLLCICQPGTTNIELISGKIQNGRIYL